MFCSQTLKERVCSKIKSYTLDASKDYLMPLKYPFQKEPLTSGEPFV